MEMEKIKASGSDTGLVKIELNDRGEYTVISLDDSTFFDRFVAGFKEITDKSDRTSKAVEEIENRYADSEGFEAIMNKAMEMSKLNVEFSKNAIMIIDGIFGGGTVEKYYRDTYEEIQDFLPSVDNIMDLIDQLTPEMEALFRRRVEARESERRKRMDKYKPQDHKRGRKPNTALHKVE